MYLISITISSSTITCPASRGFSLAWLLAFYGVLRAASLSRSLTGCQQTNYATNMTSETQKNKQQRNLCFQGNRYKAVLKEKL